MTKLSLENIKKFLQSKSLDAQIQQETQQVYVILKIDNVDYPLFVRIYDQGDLVQLLVFLPFQLKKETMPDVARLLHLFNKELDIPGFGMDEASEVAFFRIMMPSLDGEMDEKLFGHFLETIQIACKTFTQPIEAIAAGAVPFEEILKKIQETPPE